MSVTLHQGDCLDVLKTLPDNCVHCCITSPPYFGLRDYGTAKWEGGDSACDHNPQKPDGGERSNRTLPAGRGGVYKTVCSKCGAVRVDSQIGLEESPEQYVAKLVNVFREARRVLRDDGTVWLNLGDSYNGGGTRHGGSNQGISQSRKRQLFEGTTNVMGLKPKDLIGIPWRVAFALQADGWYLRSDVIWHKPNPMPESVSDRPTKSHEYVFLLSKSSRYFYDAEAIKEPAAYDGRKDEQFKGAIKLYDGVMPNGEPQIFAQNGHPRWSKNADGLRVRNKRSVWTIPTQGFREAHFATFPEKLVEPMILAGTSAKGCCPECGNPWERIIEKSGGTVGKGWTDHQQDLRQGMSQIGCAGLGSKTNIDGEFYHVTTIGWRPTCTHNLEPVPCTVLDIFSGAATTGLVAIKNQRNYIGIELNPEYVAMSKKRIDGIPVKYSI